MNETHLESLRSLRNAYAHGLIYSPSELSSQLSSLGISIPESDAQEFLRDVSGAVDRHSTAFPSPILLRAISALVSHKPIHTSCDPWASIATPLALNSVIPDRASLKTALAITRSQHTERIGKLLVADVQWVLGDPLKVLESWTANFDLVIGILPWGSKSPYPVTMKSSNGNPVILRSDLSEQILAISSSTLSFDGLGLYVVAPSFFISEKSVFRRLDELGLRVSAAFALPAGLFTPLTNITTYLVVVSKGPQTPMFVAQLSGDGKSNDKAISNFLNGDDEGTLELGRFIDPTSFWGIDRLEFEDWIGGLEARLGSSLATLDSLITQLHVGRSGDHFEFKNLENAAYIPVVGNSDVVDSIEGFQITPQNYVQAVIDPLQSQAGFVASFLNSDVGREMRERMKSGVIPRLNSSSIRALKILVPPLSEQTEILELDSQLWSAQNVLQGLENELVDIRRALWSSFGDSETEGRVRSFTARISDGLGQQAAQSLEQWFETLPFPLASILRTWQATPDRTPEIKYRHLIQFFEATAEFLSVILLSAFSSNASVLELQRPSLLRALQGGRLAVESGTFGTWKAIVDNLGKQTRVLLQGKPEDRALCAELFASSSLVLPAFVSDGRLSELLQRTNQLRNADVHGGIVGRQLAQRLNEILLSEVQNLRSITADTWEDTELVKPSSSILRRGVYENDLSVLMGSNTGFITRTRSMSTALDVESLYLLSAGAGRGLELLPLVRLGASQDTAQNAWYFFNRVEGKQVRYVSYHFVEESDYYGPVEDLKAVLSMLSESRSPLTQD